MRKAMFRILVSAGLVLLFQTACVDATEAKTGHASLYVYDGTSHTVLAWSDIATIYDAGDAGAADRTITSGKLTDFALAPAGMALDGNGQRLYLVSSGGTVVRINRVGQQSGSVSSADVISFTLDDNGTDISDGIFGQASVNPLGDTLYVTETSSSSDTTQIWAVPVSAMGEGVTITQSEATLFGTTSDTGDKNGTGIAAASNGVVYVYFETGGTLSSGGTDYDGHRLRKGSAWGFSVTSNVIVGDTSTTLLGKYGCLAYDRRNDRLYFARHNTDSGATENPLLSYLPGDFSPGMDFKTDTTLPGPDDLRVIAHAGQKDWLIGTGTSSTSSLYVWKGPSQGGTYVTIPLSGVQIQGLALDGSN